jgi:hypothetical protein
MTKKNVETLFEQIQSMDYILEHWQQKNGEKAGVHGNDSMRYKRALKIKFDLVNEYLDAIEPVVDKAKE